MQIKEQGQNQQHSGLSKNTEALVTQENIPISSLTTMRLGGKARYVISIQNLQDIKDAYAFAKEKNLPTFVLGQGANTIGRDEGFNGVILLNQLKGIEIVSKTSDEVVIRAMGGEIWDGLVEFTTERGYSGIEAMSKIPGTVGAAPVQNIGAYGQEIKNVLESVEVYDTKNDELIVLGIEDLKMDYRSTIFNSGKDVGRYFIVAVTLILENEATLAPPFYTSLQNYVDTHHETNFSPKNIRKMVSIIRSEKLPDPKQEASAGSFFKNIYLSDEEVAKAKAQGLKVWDKSDGKKMLNSGLLIEKAGLKGKELNGFQISEKAALILINKSATSYQNLEKARKSIRKIVQEKYGFYLEQEPVEIPTGKES